MKKIDTVPKETGSYKARYEKDLLSTGAKTRHSMSRPVTFLSPVDRIICKLRIALYHDLTYDTLEKQLKNAIKNCYCYNLVQRTNASVYKICE
jgi:hypothetical protein